jgi:hypothetical protein
MHILHYIYTSSHSIPSNHLHSFLTPTYALPRHLHLHLLKRILDHIVLAHHHLALLLRAHMLDPHLPRPLAQELAYKPRIPQLARNAQVLAAPHQRVGLAALGGRRDAVGVEVLLLAAGYGYETIETSVCCSGVEMVEGLKLGNG